ncbi:MAG: RNA polymerase sigma factor [Solirubrobacterales bacterium]
MRTKARASEALSRELAETRLIALYEEHGREVLAYALRRVGDPEDAADVVAETLLVAWRQVGRIPAGEEARLWLYGVARRTLANQRRGERRRARLAERLRRELASTVAPASNPGTPVLRALAALSEDDRELLLLAGWEELAPKQIARVLGVSTVAARSRLHRARRRLRRGMAAADAEAAGQAVAAEVECGGAR